MNNRDLHLTLRCRHVLLFLTDQLPLFRKSRLKTAKTEFAWLILKN